MRLRFLLPLTAVTVLLTAVGAWVSRAQAPKPPPQQTPVRRFALQGAGSCAAAACHNADGLTGFTGREYRISLERDFTEERPRFKDKHAQAYAVLFEERSHQIVGRWRGFNATAIVHPEREALCLRCHVHPTFDSQSPSAVAAFRWEDGVSCESCHGPAERWLTAHFRPGWKELSVKTRADLGMTDTRSVLGRVRVCVDCHVGSPSAEVDHDLIAAGHPWLHFDLADYHARWHKHWDPANDASQPDFERRLARAGRLAAASAALRLLADHATDSKRAWPEFADLDCIACHHTPTFSGVKREAKAGMPLMNGWYTAHLPTAVPADKRGDVEQSLRELGTLMATWRPDRTKVAAKARAAGADLDTWLDQWERDDRPK